ncbi:cuticle protein AM1239-like [Penaeus monodon]|uniref:cuticle protein AM1239-like n=1 Tax=Penaeus monodon TaxID=6687 RepID=UPI0018A7525F|nr:cuticle protein AM1239-like [Penaeus monodon]
MVALQEVILLCLVGLSACQFNRGPATAGAPPIPILYDDRNGPDVSGAYDFSYGTGNGIAHQESSRPTGVDTFVVEGSYSYTAPGAHIADENGFRAESPLIPTTPAPPLHSLRQIAAAQDAFSRQGSVQQGGFQQQSGIQQQQGNLQQPAGGFQQQGGFQNRRRGFQSRRQG